jgi:outer membrane receptor protein involved in Fe transport
MSSSLRLTVLAAALAAIVPAQAQQADAAVKAEPQKDKAQAGQVQKVEVRGSTEAYNPRRDDTATKIVVNHEEIVKYGDTNVLDVLKRLPGVNIDGAAGRGGAIRMRGLSAGYTQVLINGERAPAGFSMESLAPDSIERIEVLRAASAEFSTQSIAGTINIVLKKAVKVAQRELKAGYMTGNGVKQPTLNLQLSDKAGKFSYSLSASAMHNTFGRQSPTVEEGFDPAGRQVLLRTTSSDDRGRFDSVNIGPRLNWAFENGDTLTSQTFLNASRMEMQPRRATVTQVGSPPPFPETDTRSDNDSASLRSDLNWVRKLGGSAKLDIKAGAFASRSAGDTQRFGYAGGRAVALDSFTSLESEESGYTTTGKYSTPIGEGHSLALGWDAGYSERDENRYQRDIFAGAAPHAVDEDFLAEVTRVAMYGQDEWNVTPRWSVYFGVRWEGIETTSSGTSFVGVTSNTQVWSPLFQTLYKLPGTKSDQVRLAVTRTYKAPGTQSLVPRRFTSVNNSATEPDFQGNPNLRPELALGVDASYEHYWAEGALLSASVSMREIDDFTRIALLQDSGGRWVMMPTNGGKAHSRSVEVEAKFPLKALMDGAPAIDLRASVARNWSSVDSVPGPGNRLDGQTPVTANFGADYKSGKLTAGASYSFANGGLVRTSAEQTRYVSVRRDVEAYALWKFSPKTQLRTTLLNVLAQDYINDSAYADSSGTIRRTSIFPSKVMVRAILEMKF